MIYTIAIILLVLWALGLLTGSTIGGFIHLLLAIAIVMMLANLLFRRKQA
ncbi:MAG TPA: lmo0937 family membrane protein [Verrucomicrobiae bacterium]|nr:lmo0937 family membrane protein [Verrucomicrobiae bacterium]